MEKTVLITGASSGIGLETARIFASNGYELILGSKKDPVFGSVILFGMGGIYTELFKDRSIGFPPLNHHPQLNL